MMRETIIHAYYDELLTVAEIASMYRIDPTYVIDVIHNIA